MTIRSQLSGVTRRYGGHVAITNVTFTIHAHEVVGLIGPNGAGKTTMLRVLAGLIRPSRGIVELSTTDGPPVVRYFAGEHTLPPSVPASRWLKLWSAPTAPSSTGSRPMSVLSRGTRQRVGLEAMLAEPRPTMLLLDEPWEGLDPDASRWLSDELIKRRDAGAAVLVSSHRIHDLADVCDRCVFLVNGRIAPESLDAVDLTGLADRSALLYAAFDRAKRSC